MNTTQKGFIGVLFLIIISVVAVGGGGFYVYEKQKAEKEVKTVEEKGAEIQIENKNTVTTTKTEQSTKKDNAGEIKIETNIKADVSSTVDCGSESCFQEKFSACQPATVTSDAGFAASYFKIIGPKSGKCEVSFKYVKNPNPAWVNQEMTCVMDNKVSFQKSFENEFNAVIDGSSSCKGPLVGVLQAL